MRNKSGFLFSVFCFLFMSFLGYASEVTSGIVEEEYFSSETFSENSSEAVEEKNKAIDTIHNNSDNYRIESNESTQEEYSSEEKYLKHDIVPSQDILGKLPASMITRGRWVMNDGRILDDVLGSLPHAALQADFYDFLQNQSFTLGYVKGSSAEVVYVPNTSEDRFTELGHPTYQKYYSGNLSAFWISSNNWGMHRYAGTDMTRTRNMLRSVRGLGNDIRSTDSSSISYITDDQTIKADVYLESENIKIIYTRLKNNYSTNASFSDDFFILGGSNLDLWVTNIGHGQLNRDGVYQGDSVSQLRAWNEHNIFNLENMNLLEAPPVISVTSKANLIVNIGADLLEPQNYVTVSNRMVGGSLSYSWGERPDFSRVGKATGTVIVEDTLGGYKNVQSEKVVFNVIGPTPVVKVNQGSVLLGTPIDQVDFKSFIESVTVNGSQVNLENVNVRPIGGSINTSIIQNQNQRIRVSYNGLDTDTDVSININWGSSISIYGAWLGGYGRNIGGFTLHPGLGISYSRVNPNNPNQAVLAQQRNNVISNFSLISGENNILVGNTETKFEFEIRGNDSPNNITNRFRNSIEGNNYLSTSVGDVVSSWHRFRNGHSHYNSRNWNMFYENEKRVDVSAGMNTVFYEVTEKEFKPLKINQAIVKPATIKRTMTDYELDKSISNYIELPEGVKVVGFINYPDRDQLGKTTGTIRLEEQLSTGRVIQHDYEIDFTIVLGELKISDLNNLDLEFGKISPSSREQVVRALGESAPSITINDNSNVTQWSLYASATPFVTINNQKLHGASIIIDKLSTVNTVHHDLFINKNTISLSEEQSLIAAMSNPNHINGTEDGNTTFQIGNVRNNELTGVLLNLAGNISMDKGDYRSVITWELVGDPTL